jgi:hypothetical protein
LIRPMPIGFLLDNHPPIPEHTRVKRFGGVPGARTGTPDRTPGRPVIAPAALGVPRCSRRLPPCRAGVDDHQPDPQEVVAPAAAAARRARRDRVVVQDDALASASRGRRLDGC